MTEPVRLLAPSIIGIGRTILWPALPAFVVYAPASSVCRRRPSLKSLASRPAKGLVSAVRYEGVLTPLEARRRANLCGCLAMHLTIM